jgi:hypothetical protein
MVLCGRKPSPPGHRCQHHGCDKSREIGKLTEDDKIYVDAAQPATLNNGGGKLADYPTLQEAVVAWQRLAPEHKTRAIVKLIGGPVYTVKEIERLCCGTKPA